MSKKLEIHDYVARDQLEEVTKLIAGGKVTVNDKDVLWQTPLHISSSLGLYNMTYYLLSQGANVHARDKQGFTPLHNAAKNGRLSVCVLLLIRGANPDAPDVGGTTPLHNIIDTDYSEELIEVIELMFANGVDVDNCSPANNMESPLMEAATKGRTESVRLLLDFHADADHKNKDGETVLHKAVLSGVKDIVICLMKSGAKPDVECQKHGGTAIDLAKKLGREDLVRIMAERELGGSSYTEYQTGTGGKNPFRRQEIKKFQAKEEQQFSEETLSPKAPRRPQKSSSEINLLDTPPDSPSLSARNADKMSMLIEKQKQREEMMAKKEQARIREEQKAKEEKIKELQERKLKEISEKFQPIIKEVKGFKCEFGKSGANDDRRLIFPPLIYKYFFYSTEHYNFLGLVNRKGSTEKFYPIAVSILLENNGNVDTILQRTFTNRFRIIIWGRGGDEYTFLVNDHPSSKPINWKKGLPSDIELHIKKYLGDMRKEKPEDVQLHLEYIKSPELSDQLLEFEVGDPLKTKCFSVGVLYSKAGQTNESEMFNNENASPAFEEFLNLLGDKIPLQGWTGHRGDLDLKDNATGRYSVYRRWKGMEIMFHVSTLLPYMPGAEQQLHRKRRIGNDIGVIVFQEGGEYTPPIKSNFLHCYYVVSPVETNKMSKLKTHYRFAVTTVDTVPDFAPEIHEGGLYEKNNNFRDFLLTKVLNGHLTALQCTPTLKESIWCKPKESFLDGLVHSFVKEKSILKKLPEKKT